MSFADMNRTQSLLDEQGLDGLLVVSPENFGYFAGVSGFPATMWRRVGPASVVITANGKTTFIVPDTREESIRRLNPNSQILSHPLWIERVDVSLESERSVEDIIAEATVGRAADRPETYDESLVFQHLLTAIADSGLLGKRVGIEMEAAPALDIERLRERLGDTELVNSSPLIRELRVIKTEDEINHLRLGNEITEEGIMSSLADLSEDTLTVDIFARYNEATYAAARARRVTGFETSRTTVHLGPYLWGTGDPMRQAQKGDVIQFDSGVTIQGYQSDIGRTFTFGQPNDVQKRIEEALLAGYNAGLTELRPGRRYCDVFRATEKAVRDAGFPSYTRGHFGHSIGSEVFGEEWPWISASEDRLLEPGMVIAFEVPYYINGIGGFQNEDNILITHDGHESFNTLPMNIVAIG